MSGYENQSQNVFCFCFLIHLFEHNNVILSKLKIHDIVYITMFNAYYYFSKRVINIHG